MPSTKAEDEKTVNNLPVFQANNHSKWQINWNPVLNHRLLKEIGDVLLLGYDIHNTAMSAWQVDEWEEMSNNFKVVLETQKGPKKFLLRKNIAIKSAESLEVMEKLSAFLRDSAGIPTPRAIETGYSDESLFFDYQGSFYQLFEFIKGDHFRGLEKELADFAGNLARVHIALANLTFTEKIKNLRPRILIPWDRAGWEKIFSYCQRKSTEIDLAIISDREMIQKAADYVVSFASANTRKQVIKGDQHPLNTLYDNGKLVALLDFADAEFSELIKDVGNACHRFVRQFVVFQESDWRKTLPHGLNIFFSCYQSINPLTKSERTLIPSAILNGLLQKIYSRLYKYYLTSESEKYSDVAEIKKLLGLLQEAELVNDFIRKIL